MIRIALVVLSVCLAACCRPAEKPATGEGALVWVARTVSGGRQCEPREEFTVPETTALLAGVGVEPRSTATEELGVCMACDCPASAARLFARIRVADLESAARAGFEPSDAPDPAWQ